MPPGANKVQKKKEPEEVAPQDEKEGWGAFAKRMCRLLYASFVKGSPPEPCEEVEHLFHSLHMPKKQQLMMYTVFHELRQGEVDRIVKTAVAVKKDSIYELVLERRRWCEDILKALLEIGGCEEDDEEVHWDDFLYILLRFCSLSKVELCQALFLVIGQKLESKQRHYLTMHQLIEFYSLYAKCPVTSFNTRAIDFSRLPLRRYYVEDFAELVQRFTVLLNPTIHLQRSLQEFLPCVDFWDDHARSEVVVRKITLDFFRIDKKHCYLWGEPPFRESAEMLAPEALGFEALNKDQWEMRTFDLHERIGALSEGGSYSKDGQLVAPPGFQYRSLKQFSVWGEQPSPEETERMMLEAESDDVYLSAAGYITKRQKADDYFEEDAKAHEDAAKKQQLEAENKKQKVKALARLGMDVSFNDEELDPLADPVASCLRGAALDETFNPPPVDMPPMWMKKATIAPAPRILRPDPPLKRSHQRDQPGNSTASAFWNSGASWVPPMGQTADTWGATATSFGKGLGSPVPSPTSTKRGGNQVKFSDM